MQKYAKMQRLVFIHVNLRQLYFKLMKTVENENTSVTVTWIHEALKAATSNIPFAVSVLNINQTIDKDKITHFS